MLLNSLICVSQGSSLPSSTSNQELAQAFVTYFRDKVHTIRTSLDAVTVSEVDTDSKSPYHPPSLTAFQPQTHDDVRRIIERCATKTCSLDSLPTVILKQPDVLKAVLPK